MARTLKVVDSGHNSETATLDNEKLRGIVGEGVIVKQQQKMLANQLKEIVEAGEKATAVTKAELRALITLAFAALDRDKDVDAERSRMDELLAALGPFADLPLGQAAVASAD